MRKGAVATFLWLIAHLNATFAQSASQHCTNGEIRLVDGPVENAGRVEVCIHGVWGTVCSDSLNDGYGNFSTVVCRQLGYNVDTDEIFTRYGSAFGQATGPVLLYYVRCIGTESSVLSCDVREPKDYLNGYFNSNSCDNDVGVVCPLHCTNGTLRLVNGSLESAGTVEVCINGVWGTVCGTDLDITGATVVCRQLGFSVNTSEAIAVFRAAFGQGTGPILLNGVGCTGNESSLLSCSHDETVNYCSHSSEAGVLCLVSIQNCIDGTVRLVNGPLESAGRVEICFNGVWGTVCHRSWQTSSYWDNNFARIVCSQLGYSVNTSEAIVVYQAGFGQGTGPIFLSNVRCTGTESSLLSCSHSGIGVAVYCSHYSDAGVICSSSAQDCTNETLRLVDGPVESAGRVEVRINGVWGTVCDNGWDNNDARVVCRQLGYSVNTGGAIAVFRAGFGQGTGPVFLERVSCYGTESSLLSCRRTEIPSCYHSSDAGVVCSSSTQFCNNETLRLVDGPVESAGRVEVCIHGVWGTVCDNGWDDNDARVVCRQLGYSVNTGGAIAVFRAGFGQGTGPVFLNRVSCYGTESSLLSCRRTGLGVSYCSHYYDAGVVCSSSVQSCNNGALRLVDGPLESTGRVEICINGVWGTVCNSYWDNNDARVVCRQLGYSNNTGVVTTFQPTSGQGSGPALLTNVGCTGTESSLLTCWRSGIPSCSQNSYAEVACSSSIETCTNGRVRLADGPVESAGRVEICISGLWGTVCRVGWDKNAATVVCRQLGYNVNTGAHGAFVVLWGGFGPGTGPASLDDVRCTGNESSLLSCSHDVISCSHFEDVGVVCPMDSCHPNPCTNGGTCSVQGATNYTCDCAAEFTGTNCSLDLKFCTLSTCLNGGTCIEGQGTETSCICVEGFNGTSCEADLSFCEVDTCLNGGTCHEGFGTVTNCNCAAGFTGANCSSDLSFCTPSTCLNGGTCIEGYGTETSCMCTKDFSGRNCTMYSPEMLAARQTGIIIGVILGVLFLVTVSLCVGICICLLASKRRDKKPTLNAAEDSFMQGQPQAKQSTF